MIDEDILETHGQGEQNENRELFTTVGAVIQNVISRSTFLYKRILYISVMWESLDYNKQNQIDHVCINKKFG